MIPARNIYQNNSQNRKSHSQPSNVSVNAKALRVKLAPLNRFKPSSKIFYWQLQGGTSFVDLLCFFLSCVCYVFVHVCLYVLCGYLLGKGWPLGSRLWCLTVNLSLFHWYPGSGVVLDCIESWSLHPYLLLFSHFSVHKLQRISKLIAWNSHLALKAAVTSQCDVTRHLD